MMLAPCVPQVLATFDTSEDHAALGAFSVSVYMLGFTVGILLLAPFANVYGRAVVIRCSSAGFLAFTFMCGFSKSLYMLIGARLLAGCCAGVPMAVGGVIVADIFPPGAREKAIAAYTFSVMLAPAVGPILGSTINGLFGWRWVFWTGSIMVSDSSPWVAKTKVPFRPASVH